MKVMLADPQPLARVGMRAVLENVTGVEIVAETSTAADLPAKLDQFRPDLLVAELSLTGPRPEDWIRVARTLLPSLKILICTACRKPEVIERITSCGAEGYILKTEATATFAQAVRAVTQGDCWFSQEVLGKLLACKSDTLRPRLTRRETEVITLLKCGWSNRRIAECLCLAEQTICNHVRSIYDKLHLNNRIEVALWARDQAPAV